MRRHKLPDILMPINLIHDAACAEYDLKKLLKAFKKASGWILLRLVPPHRRLANYGDQWSDLRSYRNLPATVPSSMMRRLAKSSNSRVINVRR